jgi:hemolysin activation/secretion protein
VRLGFQHNQLTNHDDTLNVDLVSTTDFKTYGSFISYRIPVWRPAKIILRVYGSYGDFVAAEGDAAINLRYVGRNWLGGMELSNRVSLWRDWQLVSVLGANFNHYGIQQKIGDRTKPLVDASSDFLVPFIGTTLSRNYSWGGISGGVRVDHTIEGYANLDRTKGIQALGRSNVDADWTSARWNLNGTVYLDRLFRRSPEGPLAHELSLRAKGRVLLRGENKRLIPHEQEPLGGALSIRGYAEATLSADEFYAGTIEYAFHIPRVLKTGDEGKLWRWPFKWRPKQTGQNPDWDLVLRGFYDYAYRGVTPPPRPEGQSQEEYEKSLTYIDKSIAISGMGAGISLTVKQNFSLRCDYGMSLTELRDNDQPEGKQVLVPAGNKEIYFVASFSW